MSSSLSIGGFPLQPTAPVAGADQTGRAARQRPDAAANQGPSASVPTATRSAADAELAKLASGIAATRLGAAAERLASADRAGATGPGETRAGLRSEVQQRGADFIAVGNRAATLNGMQTGSPDAASRQAATARRELMDFVRSNGSAEEIKAAEAFFRGEVKAEGTRPGAPTDPGVPASPQARERLDRDREALARLTQMNTSLRQGMAFGNAPRGSMLNVLA